MQNAHGKEQYVGRSFKPVEDPRLIIGSGEFLEDVQVDGLTHITFVRSPHAHAKILSIDTSAAAALPGVVAVLTSADLPGIESIPVSGSFDIPASPPLASGVVKFVGDPVVAVIADDRNVSRDAAELVLVEYEPLASVVDPIAAMAPDATRVHDGFESNIVNSAVKETEHVDQVFEDAEHHLQVRVGHGRVAAVPMEPRGGLGVYDAETDNYTLYLSTQAAWTERTDVAQALGLSEDQIRVITPDVGGAFGGKMTLYRETVLILAAAKIIGRPVRWIASRMEDLQSSMHGREAFTDGEVAYDSDGTIKALKLKTVSNLGSYLMKYSAGPQMRMTLFPTGAYKINEFRSEVVAVFTHTGPMGPYRGAGRPEAAYFIERVVSDVAHALGMDQAEIRRRNFIQDDEFPYTNAAGATYDIGRYELALDRALELIDYETTKQQIEQRRQQGEIVGIGIASCIEVSGGASESGSLTLHEDGRVSIVTGASPHGQGLVTSLVQIASDELGVLPESISVTFGDTAVGPRGGGTMGSRSLQLGGSAIKNAAERVRETVLTKAAALLEVSPDDLSLTDGNILPAGSPERALSLSEVVGNIVREESWDESSEVPAVHGIHETVQFSAGGETFPFGTTIVIVAIDRDTGKPSVERFVSVDDVGNVINPLFVEGQLIGGVVQGISETLWEQVMYDDDGQLISGTFMDYAIPKASWLPRFELERTTTPTPNNPLGAKGVGEAGTVHAPPAVANAVMDALRPFAVEPLDLPITIEKVWRIIHVGGQGIR